MMQLFCPACENVVWVEPEEGAEAAPCPECGQPIHAHDKRKGRAPSGAAPLGARPPAPFPTAEAIRRPAALPSHPVPEDEAVEDVVADEEGRAAEPGEDFGELGDEPTPRFVALPYRPEGGCSVLRLPLLALLSLPAVGLGWLASTLGQSWYLVLLFPLGIGIALAALGALAVRLTKLRNPFLAGLLGLSAGGLAIVAMHFFDYQQARHLAGTGSAAVPDALRQQLAEGGGLAAYLDTLAAIGVTVSDRKDAGFNLGYAGTVAYWGLELIVVAGLALFGARSAAARPFCAECGTWKRECLLGELHEDGDIVRVMRRGNLGLLLERGTAAAGGELLLSAFACPRCGAGAPVDVRVERVVGRKGRPAGELVHLTYPGEALPVLERLLQAES